MPLNAGPEYFVAQDKYLKAKSFVADKFWEPDGKITGDKDRKLLIAVGDTVYINLGEDKVKPGMQCEIFRKVTKVRDPQTKAFIGYELRRLGKLEITDQVGKKISTARVILSYEPIQLNDLVKIIEKKN